MSLLDKLQSTKNRFQELESQLSAPEILSNPKKLREVNEEYSDLKEVIDIAKRYEKVLADLNGAKETLKESTDEQMRELAQTEIETLEARLPSLERELLYSLISPDPMDKKNTIVEIRAGAGGDEASLFAAELMRMYMLYAEQQGWKTELISSNRNEIGGFKEIILTIKGHNVYSRLKYESGVHRVQRVPETEKQGRVHTSTVTVAILPEAEEIDVQIKPEDLNIEATTAGGHGGQSVNTTYSAIRITHIPTGIMASCQEERSQKQNKERALSIIRARVFAFEQEKAHKERVEARKGQIGTGDRSEKIRTYNFPQDRITDHRINENFHNITAFMNGGLDELFAALKEAEVAEQLDQ
ncbi:peptide chain release factor 1 [Candidatus Uhrbacteria bacterium]|nr:peptide chain release factor 1 [Candidatus Uhrbacteria bacterium]